MTYKSDFKEKQKAFSLKSSLKRKFSFERTLKEERKQDEVDSRFVVVDVDLLQERLVDVGRTPERHRHR